MKQTVDDSPKALHHPDTKPLQDACQEYIDMVAAGGYVEEDYAHRVFEVAMECVYGKDVWRWLNHRGRYAYAE